MRIWRKAIRSSELTTVTVRLLQITALLVLTSSLTLGTYIRKFSINGWLSEGYSSYALRAGWGYYG